MDDMISRQVARREQFGNSEQLDCSDCVNHGGDWDCDHVHCRKGTDTISRQAAIQTAEQMYKRCDTSSIEDYHDLMVEALTALPSAQSEQLFKINDLVDGTIDHFDKDDAMDLLYAIKGVLKNG